MTKAIKFFKGDYDFLSNFFLCKIEYDGLTYTNSEAAFQAQKCINVDDRKRFTNLDGQSAKNLGKSIRLRSDWEDVKVEIMYKILGAKFTQNQDLKVRLLATGDAYLMEGNYWRDTFWGVCGGKGQNYLGRLCMLVRKRIIEMES